MRGSRSECECRSVPYRNNTAGRSLQVVGVRLTIHNNGYRNQSCAASWSKDGERKWR